jgi:hypothetical protein
MRRMRLVGSAVAAVLVLGALLASSAAGEGWVAAPELKAKGTTLEWTAVPGATLYQVFWWTKAYPYNPQKKQVTGLSFTPPVEAGETVRYVVKSVTPKSYLSNTIFISYHLFKFKAESYPVTIRARQLNDQGLQLPGTVFVCKKLTAEGKSTSESETLEVHPEYTECETTDYGPALKVTVSTEGCNYVLHVFPSEWGLGYKEPAGSGSLSLDILCAAGKEIVVHVERLEGCEVKVPSQNNLKALEYVNEGAGSGRKVKVNASLTGMKWSATGGCGLKENSGSNGEYREGRFNRELTELGSGPASAIFEGFTGTNAADGVFVG